MRTFKAALILCFVLLAGCSGQHIPLGGEAVQNLVDVEKTEPVNSFEFVSSAVFVPKCLECHGGERLINGQMVKVVRAGIDLTDYESLFKGSNPLLVVGDISKGQILAAIRSGRMPDGNRPKVTPEELSILEEWILEGAPLNAEVSAPSQPSNEEEPPVIIQPPSGGIGTIGQLTPVEEGELVTYEKVFSDIFGPKCTRCHSGPSAEAFVDVTDLDSLKNNFMYPDLIKKGNPSDSRLYRVLESGRMPFGMARLTQAELDLVSRWITEGPDL